MEFSKPDQKVPTWRGDATGGKYITSADVASLPTEEVAMGAWVYCVDTQEVYMFNATTKQWVVQ